MRKNSVNVDCYGGGTCPQVDEGDSVLQFLVGQDSPGCRNRAEICPDNGYSEVVENLVEGIHAASLAYENLEIARERRADHSHDIVLAELDVLRRGERLGHGPVNHLILRLVKLAVIHRHLLQHPDLVLGDAVIRIGPRELARSHPLLHIASRKPDRNLKNLYLQFVLRLRHKGSDNFLHFGNIEDSTVPHAGRRCRSVEQYLDIVSEDSRNGQSRLAGPEVNHRQISFRIFIECIHIIFLFSIFCKQSVLRMIRPQWNNILLPSCS